MARDRGAAAEFVQRTTERSGLTNGCFLSRPLHGLAIDVASRPRQ